MENTDIQTNPICLFSSDARPLYLRGVFEAMTYPIGFVMQFRYDPKYIEGDYTKMTNRKGMIFLNGGNDLSKPDIERSTINIALREIIIKETEEMLDTGLVHFYIEMGEFVNAEVDESDINKLPTKKFVSELKLKDKKKVNWHQKVDSIKNYFPNELFYSFRISNQKDQKDLPINYDNSEKQSFYLLSDESNYNLKMAFYDTEDIASKNYHSIKIKSLNEQLLNVSFPEIFKINARKDNRIISIFTKNVSSKNSFSYLNIETVKEVLNASGGADLIFQSDSEIKIKIEKSTSRIFRFAFWSLCAAISLGWGKLISDNIKLDGVFNWHLTIQLLLASLLGFLAAFHLYKFFDKK